MSIDVTGFSFSSISTCKSCPRAYKYKYIEQVPEAFSSIEAHMGSCVHEALEWAYAQRQQDHEPTPDMALQQYKYAWNSGNFDNIRIVKEEKSEKDYFHLGGEFIVSFFQRVFPYDQSTTLYLEHQFELPLGEEINYRGVIDRIAKEPDGTLRIIDYKTGRVGHPLDTLQLPSYALYIFQHNIDQQIELCLEDLREARTMVVPFSRKEAKKVKEELMKEIIQIKTTREEDFITKPSILCLWCGYNHICPNPHESVNRTGKKETTVITGEWQEACPLCGGLLQERMGKFGPFLGCSHFPQCRYTRDLGVKKT
ncbi:MAG: PD-(D/E)XK nuclease family protein [Candidatus Aminicenantes bacterium]|nr:MAG: PD-(D/E)XK nuclease family protein [Candidatus Aminicenantes bacterium]